MNKKKHVTRGKEPSSSPRYKEHSSQTELLYNVFSNNSRSRTFPLFILPKPFPRFKHLPPLPLVFFATISIQLAPLCHLLRIHSFERQFQACSQGNETLGPEHLTSLLSFPPLYYRLYHVPGPVASPGCVNSQISKHASSFQHPGSLTLSDTRCIFPLSQHG